MGRGPSGSRTEAGAGSWTVPRLHSPPPQPREASEEGANGHKCPVRLQLKVVLKVLRVAALRNTEQGRVKLAISLVYSCPLELKQVVKGCGGLLEGRKL